MWNYRITIYLTLLLTVCLWALLQYNFIQLMFMQCSVAGCHWLLGSADVETAMVDRIVVQLFMSWLKFKRKRKDRGAFACCGVVAWEMSSKVDFTYWLKPLTWLFCVFTQGKQAREIACRSSITQAHFWPATVLIPRVFRKWQLTSQATPLSKKRLRVDNKNSNPLNIQKSRPGNCKFQKLLK